MSVATLTPPVSEADHSAGPDGAPVTLVEYGDYECPYCGMAHPIVKRAQGELGSQLRFVFRNFPLAEAHPHARLAAQAAEAAGAQGKFWEMHDMLFANQDRWNGEATSSPKGEFKGYAQSLGLDVPKWEACYDADRYRSRVASNRAESERRHVESTPTFIIGGKMVAGALTYDQFMKYYEEAAKAAAAKAPAAPDAGTDSGKKL
jgi:formate-nitrite transporter family protein